MASWLWVLLVIGATFRLTRLVTADRLSEGLRGRLADRWGDDSLRGYFLSCDWCVSIWVAPPVAFAAVWWPDNRGVAVVLLALSASAATGLIASWLDV